MRHSDSLKRDLVTTIRSQIHTQSLTPTTMNVGNWQLYQNDSGELVAINRITLREVILAIP